jgi:hypothetical protein
MRTAAAAGTHRAPVATVRATGATVPRARGGEPPAGARITAGRAAANTGAKPGPRGRRLALVATKQQPAAKSARAGDRKAIGRAAGRVGVPTRTVKIKELNAQGKCGPGTSVVHLYRVDEVRDGTPAVHLVFFDRHGWYCEHGRSCHAVDDVRKLAGSSAARTYSVG